MNLAQIDRLNTLLIFGSFILAYYFPFELFIVIYALLGPLHYLTEINWIRDKQYFTGAGTRHRSWAGSMLVFALIATLPVALGLLSSAGENRSLLKQAGAYSITLLPVAFLIAFLAISSFPRRTKGWLLLCGLVIILLMSLLPAYQVVMGVFLPTVIHVYFFTLLFMWYGTLKSPGRVGKLNILLMILLPLFLFIADIDAETYSHQTNVLRSIFVENRFYELNAHISKVLGLSDGKHFSFFETFFVRIQIFIAFAYTYHYLNWFSKTTVIGWHRQLTRRRSLVILLVWLASVALYWYNYKAGVAIILFLSLLHVLLEFPLNIITIKGIVRTIGARGKQ